MHLEHGQVDVIILTQLNKTKMQKDLLEFKGSEGNWSYEGGDNNSIDIVLDDETTISIDRTSRYTNEYVISREKMEYNAILISNAPKMIQTLVSTYIKLNQLSKADISIAIKTDETRAMLRNTIAYALKLTEQEVQEYVESKYR